jgi:Papain-like cysteine protease AvrRpt2
MKLKQFPSKLFANTAILIIGIVLSVALQSCDKTRGCKNPAANNYNAEADISDPCLCKYDGLNKFHTPKNPTTMNIAPVMQETEVWCWLAVGEMIFKHYGLPNVNPDNDYQCGIIGAVGYSLNGACDKCNVNCANCQVPAGSAEMFTRMISSYPKVASNAVYQSQNTLKSSFYSFALGEAQIKNEIDNFRPIVTGINPGQGFVLPGNSQHVALIVGYYYDNNSNFMLKINDPFPYYSKGVNVYVNAGGIDNGNLSYQISLFNFTNNLRWNTTWAQIMW